MPAADALDLKAFVRDVPDFPKPGILFKDITPLLASPEAFGETVRRIVDRFRGEPLDAIVAAEARGFIFAAPVALALGVGFVPIRKPGKLPYDRHAYEYELEYGTDRLEIHVDGVRQGDRVLVIDDLLATGGTVDACVRLLERCGATVAACAFVIELGFLAGRRKLEPHPIYSVLEY
ncbi:MAG TPA: adenine phosphoribosyltransferase [Planctomycetaceae bacterium]|nr:adenine phosphoribosyltransferase [Planctomycetaceae bacterium]HRE99505.1 adenine phosphoribosyltransferase [Pirellulaceae bacterium]